MIEMERGLNVAYLNGNLSPQELYEFGYGGMAYEYSIYLKNPVIIEDAKGLGLDIYAWTVNSTESMHRLKEIGCKYIITDKPDILNEYCCR